MKTDEHLKDTYKVKCAGILYDLSINLYPLVYSLLIMRQTTTWAKIQICYNDPNDR